MIHAGNLAHIFVCIIVNLQNALYGALILKRMVLAEQVRQLVVYLGAVFYGTGSLTDLDIDIGAQGLLRQSRVMS